MNIIEVNNLSKIYKLYNNVNDRLKEAINPFSKKQHKEFYALDNISFTMKKGENVGIIGKNGSGKSTLLKVISGILTPSKGDIQVRGKVAALLELGAGFNPEYTGLKNIFLNGMLMGYTNEEMQEKLDDIISFADIGTFIEQPVKMYSSGMYARLAFAVAINVQPDILIVDEALSVGDMAFQHKCMNRMKKMIESGTTILFVSHDPAAVKSLCNRCIYLKNGVIQADGEAREVTDMYLRDLRTKVYDIKTEIQNTGDEDLENNIEDDFIIDETLDEKVKDIRYGSGGARVRYFGMFNEKGEPATQFEFNELMTFKINVELFKDVEHLNCSLLIRDKNGVDITGTTSFEEGIKFPKLEKGDKVTIAFKAPNLLKHDMTFSVGLSINDTISLEEHEVLDVIDLAYSFKSVYNNKRPVWYSYYQAFDISYDILKLK
ncbi:ABC transporter ATP-binding protein [Clostridium sp. YIM B02555]|uniref:ABC transporter ATP-binding protein n=1 Tax=Clostridium sp. YIM B02555 TaxID=2911968 RepID=UPI001EEF50FF|nr:ABC transporter ATP-binding protein [Clostridium sp. YIM B02555]